jgi:hypothetical protein
MADHTYVFIGIRVAIAILAYEVQAFAQPAAQTNVAKPCIEPSPMVRWQDYRGPFRGFETTLVRNLDRPPAARRYKPDTVLCSIEVKDKFFNFVRDTYDPMLFMNIGFSTLLDQASRRDPVFKYGSEGYAKRFAANFASGASWRFFVDFAYPVLFSEDPRYYRVGEGGFKKRVLHATTHVFVAHHDNGAPMFNYSEWLGTTTAAAVSDLCHPGNRQGFGSVAQRVAFIALQDVGVDILKEFWPEIVRKTHLPFRDPRESTAFSQ